MIWNVQPLLPKTKIGKVRDEPKTIGVADLWHPLCYQDDNDRFIQTTSSEAVQWNKVRNKIHGGSVATFLSYCECFMIATIVPCY